MVRQAVWESLETFSAIVNAACEDDLGGEVIYLIIIISSLSSTILTGRSPHHHHCLSLSSWIVWYNVHFRDLFPGVRFDNDRGGRPKPWKKQIQLPGVYCPLLSRTGWIWSSSVWKNLISANDTCLGFGAMLVPFIEDFLAQTLFFLAMSLTSESFITERAQVDKTFSTACFEINIMF